MNPLVSVIIPTYNRANTVAHSINSALAQTYKNIEIIVVDDGSVDNTSEVLKNYHNITIVHKENGGQASARNAGLKRANGEFIASLDSDDIWYPDFLERCVQKLVSDNLDFVFANWDQENAKGNMSDFLSSDIFIQPYFHRKNNSWVNLDSNELRAVYAEACPSPSSSAVIRHSIIKQGWNNNIRVGDDWYLYLSVLYSGERKAAFTLDRLWKKCVGPINVYDGRKRSEVLEHLYIADMDKMLRDFKPKMKKNHYKLMLKKHIYSLVELAKHNLIREFNLAKTTKLLARSFYLDTRQTFKSIPQVIMFGVQRLKGEKRHQLDKAVS